MLIFKLERLIGDAESHSGRQHAFRGGHCIISAVSAVMEIFSSTLLINHYLSPLLLQVTLDARDVFNSARCDMILDALKNKFRVPLYLLRIVRSYLRDRSLTCNTEGGQRD